MQHVDEGTLHALLDGELAPAALAGVRVHFATCPSCAARLDEARQLLAETERLVSALELPGRPAQPRTGGDDGGVRQRRAAAAGALADVLMPPAPGAPLPPLDPVVLIPENPTPREVRRSRMRLMAWAAGFLVVVGAGFLGVTSYREAPARSDGRLRISPDEFTTAPPSPQREGATSDSAPTLALTDSEAPPPPVTPPSPTATGEGNAANRDRARQAAPARAAPAAPVPAVQPPGQRGALTTPEPKPEVTASQPDADRADGEAPEESKLAKAADAASRDTAAPVETRRETVNRTSAAQATYELDRRRTRERAAEATAALERELAQRRAQEERERQTAAQAAAAPAAAPAPASQPAVDERTGITRRIGLDEAARQLGGPLHAIDGMARQTVGLVPGNTVEGADPSRPVVRAVYVDGSGTMLFLDQQMARPGDGPSTPQTGRGGGQVWVKDGVLLVLHGRGLDADSLRSLTRRVR